MAWDRDGMGWVLERGGDEGGEVRWVVSEYHVQMVVMPRKEMLLIDITSDCASPIFD